MLEKQSHLTHSHTRSHDPHPRGGVHPGPGKPAIRGVSRHPSGRRGHRRAPAAAGPGAFPNFTYHGGPVITMPQVYTGFWGGLWSDRSHRSRAQRLNQFHADLLASDFMNILSQYGVGQGAGRAGTFAGATFVPNVPSTLTDADIQNLIQQQINQGNLPEPSNPSNLALLIYLDENTGINDPADGLVLCEPSNDTAFGYHEFFTCAAGNPFYYAVIPALTDMCLTASCPTDSGCSLHLAESQEQRQTQVASHEFAEMTSDPQLNAWYDPQNGENGDICNGQTDTITVGGNTWTVQKIYSKYDDEQSNGARYCLGHAAKPEPSLLPDG